MIPSLIFDLDGTLVDSLPGIAHSLNHALESQGLPTHPQQVVRTYIGNGLHMLVERAAPGADEAQVAAIIESFKHDYSQTWMEGTRPYTGIVQMLKELQRSGHQLAVLSNKPHAFTQTIVRNTFPSVHFMLAQGEEVGVPHKPNPAGAFKIANAMGRNPNDCVFIGDSVADAQTAANAEMKFIGVTWGYQDRPRLVEAGASKFIETPSALTHVLSSLESDAQA